MPEPECTNSLCSETATQIMAMPPSPQVRCLFVGLYCDEHAKEIADMGGLPASGPALSEQAQQIDGIR